MEIEIDFKILSAAQHNFENNLKLAGIKFKDKKPDNELDLGLFNYTSYTFKLDRCNTKKKLLNLNAIAKRSLEQTIQNN